MDVLKGTVSNNGEVQEKVLRSIRRRGKLLRTQLPLYKPRFINLFLIGF